MHDYTNSVKSLNIFSEVILEKMGLFTDHMEYLKIDYLGKNRNKEQDNNKKKATLKRIFNNSLD